MKLDALLHEMALCALIALGVALWLVAMVLWLAPLSRRIAWGAASALTQAVILRLLDLERWLDAKAAPAASRKGEARSS